MCGDVEDLTSFQWRAIGTRSHTYCLIHILKLLVLSHPTCLLEFGFLNSSIIFILMHSLGHDDLHGNFRESMYMTAECMCLQVRWISHS